MSGPRITLNTGLKKFNDFAGGRINTSNSGEVARIAIDRKTGETRVIAATSDSVGFISRGSGQRQLNNTARREFFRAVAAQFGGAQNIPKSVWKALNEKDFGDLRRGEDGEPGDEKFNSGKPLSRYRIQEVIKAIVSETQSDERFFEDNIIRNTLKCLRDYGRADGAVKARRALVKFFDAALPPEWWTSTHYNEKALDKWFEGKKIPIEKLKKLIHVKVIPQILDKARTGNYQSVNKLLEDSVGNLSSIFRNSAKKHPHVLDFRGRLGSILLDNADTKEFQHWSEPLLGDYDYDISGESVPRMKGEEQARSLLESSSDLLAVESKIVIRFLEALANPEDVQSRPDDYGKIAKILNCRCPEGDADEPARVREAAQKLLGVLNSLLRDDAHVNFSKKGRAEFTSFVDGFRAELAKAGVQEAAPRNAGAPQDGFQENDGLIFYDIVDAGRNLGSTVVESFYEPIRRDGEQVEGDAAERFGVVYEPDDDFRAATENAIEELTTRLYGLIDDATAKELTIPFYQLKADLAEFFAGITDRAEFFVQYPKVFERLNRFCDEIPNRQAELKIRTFVDSFKSGFDRECKNKFPLVSVREWRSLHTKLYAELEKTPEAINKFLVRVFWILDQNIRFSQKRMDELTTIAHDLAGAASRQERMGIVERLKLVYRDTVSVKNSGEPSWVRIRTSWDLCFSAVCDAIVGPEDGAAVPEVEEQPVGVRNVQLHDVHIETGYNVRDEEGLGRCAFSRYNNADDTARSLRDRILTIINGEFDAARDYRDLIARVVNLFSELSAHGALDEQGQALPVVIRQKTDYLTFLGRLSEVVEGLEVGDSRSWAIRDVGSKRDWEGIINFVFGDPSLFGVAGGGLSQAVRDSLKNILISVGQSFLPEEVQGRIFMGDAHAISFGKGPARIFPIMGQVRQACGIAANWSAGEMPGIAGYSPEDCKVACRKFAALLVGKTDNELDAMCKSPAWKHKALAGVAEQLRQIGSIRSIFDDVVRNQVSALFTKNRAEMPNDETLERCVRTVCETLKNDPAFAAVKNQIEEKAYSAESVDRDELRDQTREALENYFNEHEGYVWPLVKASSRNEDLGAENVLGYARSILENDAFYQNEVRGVVETLGIASDAFVTVAAKKLVDRLGVTDLVGQKDAVSGFLRDVLTNLKAFREVTKPEVFAAELLRDQTLAALFRDEEQKTELYGLIDRSFKAVWTNGGAWSEEDLGKLCARPPREGANPVTTWASEGWTRFCEQVRTRLSVLQDNDKVLERLFDATNLMARFDRLVNMKAEDAVKAMAEKIADGRAQLVRAVFGNENLDVESVRRSLNDAIGVYNDFLKNQAKNSFDGTAVLLKDGLLASVREGGTLRTRILREYSQFNPAQLGRLVPELIDEGTIGNLVDGWLENQKQSLEERVNKIAWRTESQGADSELISQLQTELENYIFDDLSARFAFMRDVAGVFEERMRSQGFTFTLGGQDAANMFGRVLSARVVEAYKNLSNLRERPTVEAGLDVRQLIVQEFERQYVAAVRDSHEAYTQAIRMMAENILNENILKEKSGGNLGRDPRTVIVTRMVDAVVRTGAETIKEPATYLAGICPTLLRNELELVKALRYQMSENVSALANQILGDLKSENDLAGSLNALKVNGTVQWPKLVLNEMSGKIKNRCKEFIGGINNQPLTEWPLWTNVLQEFASFGKVLVEQYADCRRQAEQKLVVGTDGNIEAFAARKAFLQEGNRLDQIVTRALTGLIGQDGAVEVALTKIANLANGEANSIGDAELEKGYLDVVKAVREKGETLSVENFAPDFKAGPIADSINGIIDTVRSHLKLLNTDLAPTVRDEFRTKIEDGLAARIRDAKKAYEEAQGASKTFDGPQIVSDYLDDLKNTCASLKYTINGIVTTIDDCKKEFGWQAWWGEWQSVSRIADSILESLRTTEFELPALEPLKEQVRKEIQEEYNSEAFAAKRFIGKKESLRIVVEGISKTFKVLFGADVKATLEEVFKTDAWKTYFASVMDAHRNSTDAGANKGKGFDVKSDCLQPIVNDLSEILFGGLSVQKNPVNEEIGRVSQVLGTGPSVGPICGNLAKNFYANILKEFVPGMTQNQVKDLIEEKYNDLKTEVNTLFRSPVIGTDGKTLEWNEVTSEMVRGGDLAKILSTAGTCYYATGVDSISNTLLSAFKTLPFGSSKEDFLKTVTNGPGADAGFPNVLKNNPGELNDVIRQIQKNGSCEQKLTNKVFEQVAGFCGALAVKAAKSGALSGDPVFRSQKTVDGGWELVFERRCAVAALGAKNQVQVNAEKSFELVRMVLKIPANFKVAENEAQQGGFFAKVKSKVKKVVSNVNPFPNCICSFNYLLKLDGNVNP